jgi:hypothetical protein
MAQSSSQGCWQDPASVLCFFQDPSKCSFEALKDALLAQLPPADQATVAEDTLRKIWITLLAIYVFESRFEDREEEWQLIVQKARQFLKTAAGIAKPEALLKQLSHLELLP